MQYKLDFNYLCDAIYWTTVLYAILKLSLSAMSRQYVLHGFILEAFELAPFQNFTNVYSRSWELECTEL